MPLPDKHVDEPTIEAPSDLWLQYTVAREKAAEWKKMADGLRDALISAMEENGATAVLVAGAKVASYRGQTNYATARLREDYPELTEHYLHDELKQVFDIDGFAKVHPEIAEKYRVRAFKDLG